MGTTAPGPIHLLELCDQKLLEFVCNVDNKDLVWLEEIEEEAERMFTRYGQGAPAGGLGDPAAPLPHWTSKTGCLLSAQYAGD